MYVEKLKKFSNMNMLGKISTHVVNQFITQLTKNLHVGKDFHTCGKSIHHTVDKESTLDNKTFLDQMKTLTSDNVSVYLNFFKAILGRYQKPEVGSFSLKYLSKNRFL